MNDFDAFISIIDIEEEQLASGDESKGSWIIIELPEGSDYTTVEIEVEAPNEPKIWHLSAVALAWIVDTQEFDVFGAYPDRNFDVEVKPTKYTLTLSVTPSESEKHMTVTGGGEYESGQKVELKTAEKVPGAEGTQYIFEKFLINGKEETANPTIITVDQDYDIVMKYSTQYYLTVESSYGTTSGEGWYEDGDKSFASLDIEKMSSGFPYVWKFKRWSGDASGTGLTSSPITMDRPKKAIAIWEQEFGCFIATATYGSELSPEVTFLRGFRDDLVLTTYAGNQFMQVFNKLYYSFSPSVARFVYENNDVGMAMKLALYPLLGILHVSAVTYSIFSFTPELAVILSGFVASSLIGLIYFTPTTLGLTMITRKFKGTKLNTGHLMPIAILVFLSILSILIGEITRITMLVQIATATFVLSIIYLTSLFATMKIAKRTRIF
ncbi:MAG: hypothetical protein NWF08_08420 [Candidatus Bathyarchaeota archaeon]|nr:hypothetical protein [Candidatus Bathyarchaeota archaeon]